MDSDPTSDPPLSIISPPHFVGDTAPVAPVTEPCQLHPAAAMPRHRQIAFGVVAMLLASAVISALFAPGKFIPDSLFQYDYALRDSYTDWHTPILEGVWGFFDTPPEYVLLLFVTMIMVSAMLLVTSETSVTWAASTVVLVCLWPMSLEVLTTITKDDWFAGFFLAGAAVSALAVRTRGRARTVAFVSIGALWWLAVAARHNAVVPIVMALIFGWPIVAADGRRRWLSRHGIKRIGLSLAIAVGTLLTQHVYVSAVVRPQHTHPEQVGYQFDLAALSLRTHQMLLPASSLRPGADLAAIRRHWAEADSDPLWFSQDSPVVFFVAPEDVDELRTAWINAVEHHPVEYVEHRLSYTLSLLGVTHRTVRIFWPPQKPSDAGFHYSISPDYAPWMRAWYERTIATSDVFASFRLWMFMVVLIGVGITRRGRHSIAVRTLVAAGLGSTLSFALAGATGAFRYSWFTMLC
ncbi:MAG TPA: hypothetical protein VFE86_04470, partial [Ilumatobacteraceae bacterium]|nr:hypothetical protein [Ilumatobacteraceae bacterium]